MELYIFRTRTAPKHNPNLPTRGQGLTGGLSPKHETKGERAQEPSSKLASSAAKPKLLLILPCSPVGVRLSLVVVHQGNRGGAHVGVCLCSDVLALLVEEEVLSFESARGFGVGGGGRNSGSNKTTVVGVTERQGRCGRQRLLVLNK